MRIRIGAVLFCAALLAPLQAVAQPAQRPLGTPALLQQLQHGGFVIYFRHGHTHWHEKLLDSGFQAEGRFDVDNCGSQRNLDDIGRDDARRINEALTALRVPIGNVYGSRYCRPSEYAQLITDKTPERVAWLTGLSTPASLRELRGRVSTVPAAGTNTVFGGHGERPFDLTGLVIAEGDALVFDPRRDSPDQSGLYRPVAWIKPAEWLALASEVQLQTGGILAITRAFAIEGSNVLDAAERDRLLRPHTGKRATVETLTSAALTVEQALRRVGQGTSRVTARDVDGSGTIRIAVAARSIGQVSVRNHQSFSTTNARSSLPQLVEGDTPDTNALARSLMLARQNPAKNTTLFYITGARAGSVDAEISVKDTKPWSIYGLAANDGARGFTRDRERFGRSRLMVGGTHANLFDRDHVLGASYAIAPDRLGDAVQWGAAYRIPIYATGGAIETHLAHSSLRGGLIAEGVRITEPGRYARIGYRQQLVPRADYHPFVSLDFEDRHFSGTDVPINVRSRPLTIAYGAHWEEQWLGWKYRFAYAQNVSGGRDGDDLTYGRNRAGADASFGVLRASADWYRILTYDWRAIVRARGQLSRDRLVAGEQFGAGSERHPWGTEFGVFARMPWMEASGVRGIEDRAVLGDLGGVLSAELWSWRMLGRDLRTGAFYDFGHARNRNAIGTERAATTVSALGLGVHYQWRGNVALSVHTAYVARGTSAVPSGRVRTIASLAVRF